MALVATNAPHMSLSSALGSMSSLYSDVDIYDSEAYDTDLDEPKEYVDPKPYIGLEAYKESCTRLKVAPQKVVMKDLNEQEMKLRNRNLGPNGIRPIIIALLKNTRVQTLDLCDTGLGDLGAGYVAQLLMDNDFICNMDLSKNFIGVQGAYILSEVLKTNNSLIRLNLSGNKLEDVAGECLAGTILVNDRLEELDLSHNNISVSGKAIGIGLVRNQCLETLKLSWNSLGKDGGAGLLQGLHKNFNLTYLDLSHNGLKYHGALALGNLLKKNKTLKYIDVSGNNITWQGILLIVPGIQKNKTLETLKIGNNPITTTGTMDLIEALSGNSCKISTLSLKLTLKVLFRKTSSYFEAHMNVLVVGEFEMMATVIRQTRPFDYEHGGIVSSHDMLGQRYDKRIDPMQKIILYMKERGLRPTELFRSFDKSVANYISHDSFLERLQKSGIDMPKYELEGLIDHLTRGNSFDSSEGFNYKVMVKSVRDQVEKDRIETIKERERSKKIKDYHKKILSKIATIPEEEELRELNDAASISDGRSLKSVVESIRILNMSVRNESSIHPHSILSTPTLPPVSQGRGLLYKGSTGSGTPRAAVPAKLMSMAGSLGGKTKEFGTQDIKKRKKKKKKTKRR